MDEITERRRLTAASLKRAAKARAENDLPVALRWLERANRLKPDDPRIELDLAVVRLALRDPAALKLFATLAERQDHDQIWWGLAAASLQADAAPQARDACATLLSCYAFEPAWKALARAVVNRLGLPGWCGLTGGAGRDKWRLVREAFSGEPLVQLDGQRLAAGANGLAVPTGTDARSLAVTVDGRHLLGSPIRVDQIRRLDGYVERQHSSVRGWAWHPHDPARDPVIDLSQGTIAPSSARLRHRLKEGLPDVVHALPRRIAIDDCRWPVRVGDQQGMPLPGSPLGPVRSRPARPPPNQVPPPARLIVLECRIDPEADELRALLDGSAVRDVLWLGAGVRLSKSARSRLRRAAYAAAEIGSVSPLLVPDDRLNALEALARRDRSPLIRLPNGPAPDAVYLRHDWLAATPLVGDWVAHGAEAITSKSRRSLRAGWRHVIQATAVASVTPVDPAGVGDRQLMARRLALRPPEPGDATERRRNLLASLWRDADHTQGAVLLITHDRGRGVEQVIQDRIAEARRDGLRPILLRPTSGPSAPSMRWCAVSDGDTADPDRLLRYQLPREWPALIALLASQRPHWAELHHRLGHHPDIVTLAERLDIPLDIWLHDYAAYCPRIDLVGVERRYCGEPLDQRVCTRCVKTLGSELDEVISIGRLRARSALEFATAENVVVPSADVMRRLRRQFSLDRPILQRGWDRMAPPALPRRRRLDHPLKVCVIGAIDVSKGGDVLLACGRDCARRELGLSFVLVGYSEADEALLETGRIWVTGPYKAAERTELIRAQQADIAFFPSVWPETWSFTLSQAWEAGLPAAVFDLGTPAERMRAAGPDGGLILPAHLAAADINDRLIAWATDG